MANEQPSLSVDNDVAGLKCVCLFQFQPITFLERRAHTPGSHAWNHDLLQDRSVNGLREFAG